MFVCLVGEPGDVGDEGYVAFERADCEVVDRDEVGADFGAGARELLLVLASAGQGTGRPQTGRTFVLARLSADLTVHCGL